MLRAEAHVPAYSDMPSLRDWLEQKELPFGGSFCAVYECSSLLFKRKSYFYGIILLFFNKNSSI
jgi:hypothetical protein